MKKGILSALMLASLTLTAGFAAHAQATIALPPTASAQPECLTAEDMNVIARSFKQFQNLAGKPYCYDGSQTAHLIATINFIRKVEFTQPAVNSTDELFSGKFANDWFGYFTKRIKTITVESSCQVGVGAFVYGGFFSNNTMHVCPLALTDAFTSLDLASIFMHEARHIDGYAHITCSGGPRANLNGACDNKISDGGSYAVTVETYSQLGQYGKDLHPAFKAIAQASSLIYAAEAFETPARINKVEAFLAITADKKLYQLDSTLTAKPIYMGETANLGHIVKSKLGLLIFPEDKNQLATRLFPTGETQAINSEYNDGTPASRADLVDYYLAWTWNARVNKKSIRFFCDKRENPTVSSDVTLPSEALSIVYTDGYSPDRNFAYLNTKAGVVQISCENGKGKVSQSNISVDTDIKRVHKANVTTIALTGTGELLNLGAQAQRVDTGLTNIFDISSYTRATFFDN